MHNTIYRFFTITSSGINLVYKTTPLMIRCTNGDSSYMIGSFLMVGLKALGPVVKISVDKIKIGHSTTYRQINSLRDRGNKFVKTILRLSEPISSAKS